MQRLSSVLIVKTGALGDVVRTSYFAESLKRVHGARMQLTWVASAAAASLLRYNPWIDRIVTSIHECVGERYDQIWSLDDERDVLEAVSALNDKRCRLSGAYIDPSGRAVYTDDAAEWFDMGLLSRYGKARADELKKLNRRGHAEIFSKIFQVDTVRPQFYGDPAEEKWALECLVCCL